MAIKSAKGTGKTEFLAKIVKQAIANQQKVLVIGHRVKLVEELCQRFGLNYISQVRDNPAAQIYGYGLCIDSLPLIVILNPLSNAQKTGFSEKPVFYSCKRQKGGINNQFLIPGFSIIMQDQNLIR